ncbi:spore coat protein [Rhizophagus irregularis]|uniref:Spore coat protein n=2 Tax=cellular organisms TaxID=131567 RepID=A0A2N0QNB4_9GLOM|nr:spore coat protein [Ureibacillus massiliensis]KGR88432.1 spore gernimation protein GerQ [Ureibacillus massiliensis 4400831 = CIP 108448 = CCUG 49529]PKC52545.1 spore coat protein [Rhizophagus irregularis]
MKDYLDPINSINMPELTDSGVALEFLLTTKTGIRNLAIAITETSTPSLRKLMKIQLNVMLDLYDEITELMMKKEWLKPFDLDSQKELDIKAAENAISIAKLELFPKNSNRKGLFPTPPKK